MFGLVRIPRGSSVFARIIFRASVRRRVPFPKPLWQPRHMPCHHLALAGSYSVSGLMKSGSWNEKDNRERGSLSCADVVGREGRGTRRRRRAGGRIGRRSPRTDRSSGWRCSGLYGRPVDFTFMGPAPLERAAPGAESREPGRACPCRRRPTCAQSVGTKRSSSSSSARASTAFRHDHGFHRAAGPTTGVIRYRY
jgi:hypothetical protein